MKGARKASAAIAAGAKLDHLAYAEIDLRACARNYAEDDGDLEWVALAQAARNFARAETVVPARLHSAPRRRAQRTR